MENEYGHYSLHQSVDLVFDTSNERIFGLTTLTLGFKDEVVNGSKIILHCRQLKIVEILMNNIPVKYDYIDPLSKLSSFENSTNENNDYSFDLSYRLGLEVSSGGELQITVPRNIQFGTVFPVSPISQHSSDFSKEAHRKIKIINKIIQGIGQDHFSNSQDFTINSDETSDCNAESSKNDGNSNSSLGQRSFPKIIQITIRYVLERRTQKLVTSSSNSFLPLNGIVFRKQKKYLDGFGGEYGNEEKSGGKSANRSDSTCCIYSFTGARDCHLLNDVDGIRCWLPCLDHPAQRPIVDITLHYPVSSNMKREAISIGCKVFHKSFEIKTGSPRPTIFSDYAKIHRDQETPLCSRWYPFERFFKGMKINSTRFISTQKIPINAVGFFIGSLESYSIPLYRIQGRVGVATNINDFVAKSNLKASSLNENNSTPEYFEESEMKNVTSSLDDKESNQCSSNDSDPRDVDYHGQDLLYEFPVTRALVGFELALRHLHKLIGRRNGNHYFTEIFVPDLGSSEFVSFDGFILVDLKYLHGLMNGSHEETALHLLVIKAYLYHWLIVSLPIMGYHYEYLVHGVVGYLHDLYQQSLFEADSSESSGISNSNLFSNSSLESIVTWRRLKRLQTVLALDRLGRGSSISLLHHFEKYEHFSPWYGLYMQEKSVLIFQLLENRCTDKDLLRKAIQRMISAPFASSLSHNFASNCCPDSPRSSLVFSHHPEGNIMGGSQVMSPIYSPPLYSLGSNSFSRRMVESPNVGVRSPLSNLLGSCDSFSPSSFHSSNSPPLRNHFHAFSSFGVASPSLHTPGMGDLPTSFDASQPFSWKDEMPSLFDDCLTGEIFVRILRDVMGVLDYLQEDFLDNFVTKSGLLLLRLLINAGDHSFSLIADQVALDHGNFIRNNSNKKEVRFRVLETRDNFVSEPILAMDKPGISIYDQSFYSRAGRPASNKYPGNGDDSAEKRKEKIEKYQSGQELLPGEKKGATKLSWFFNFLRETRFLENVLEKNGFSMAMEKNGGGGVRSLWADPYQNLYLDVNYGGIPDDILCQSVFADIKEERDIFSTIPLLFSIARTKHSTQNMKYEAVGLPKTNPGKLGQSKGKDSTGDLNSLGQNSSQMSARTLVSKPMEMLTLFECIVADQNDQYFPLVNEDLLKAGKNRPMIVRIESIRALVQWKNDHFEDGSNSANESISFLDQKSNWNAAILLYLYAIDHFYDSNMKLYKIVDFRLPMNDIQNLFNMHLLQGLASFRSFKSGVTPIEMVDLLLILWDDNARYIHDLLEVSRYQSQSLEGHSISKFLIDERKSTFIQSLFLNVFSSMNFIMRSIVFLDESKRTKEDNLLLRKLKLNAYKVLLVGMKTLKRELTAVRSQTKLSFKPNHRNSMTIFDDDGLLVASAIQLIGDIDRQCIHLFRSEQYNNIHDNHSEDIKKLEFGPTSFGCFSKLNYCQFFLPKGEILSWEQKKYFQEESSMESLKSSMDEMIKNEKKSLHNQDEDEDEDEDDDMDEGPGMPSVTIGDSLSFDCVCTPLIRLVSLESFVRHCFQEYHFLKLSFDKIPSNNFLSSGLQAIFSVIMSNSSTPYLRQEAGYCLLQVIQDLPCRWIVKELASICPGANIRCVDNQGLTLLPNLSFASKDVFQTVSHSHSVDKISSPPVAIYIQGIMNGLSEGCDNQLRSMIDLWWKLIVGFNYEQKLRSILLQAWIYVFSFNKSMASGLSSSALYSTILGSPQKDLLKFYKCPSFFHPIERYHRTEMALRFGSQYLVSKPTSIQLVSHGHTTSSNSNSSSNTSNNNYSNGRNGSMAGFNKIGITMPLPSSSGVGSTSSSTSSNSNSSSNVAPSQSFNNPLTSNSMENSNLIPSKRSFSKLN